MLIDIKMPKLGESLTEGTIIQWYKKAGEKIQKDETLLEIATDKVDSEIPSPETGIVAEILANPNDVIPVDEIIARLETDLEKATEPVSEAADVDTEDKTPISL